jgi:outer membrane receptor for ferrienterochelin and colicins
VLISRAPRILGFSFALLWTTGAIAAAQAPSADGLSGLTLEELMQVRVDSVYSASRHEQKVTQAPASVTILTSEDIRRFGYRTLAEALRSMRGLYVADDRNYSYVGTRGFLRPGDYNSRILLLIDGHRMNDNVYDAAYFSHEGMVSLDLVDRIEFVRGPSSSIYGSSAFFGIVNVVLKKAGDLEGSLLTAGVGSLGQLGASATLRSPGEGPLQAKLNASYHHSDGNSQLYYPEFDPAVSGNSMALDGGLARHVDGERAAGVMGSAAWGAFEVSGSFVSRRKDVPTASFGTVFNQRERTLDERGFADLKFEREIASDLTLLARLSYDRYAYEGMYPYDFAIQPPAEIVVSRDDTLGEWVSTEWQLTRHFSAGHTVILGADLRKNLQQRQLTFDDVVPRTYDVEADPRTRNGAIYAQGEYRFSEHVLLNAGLRYDRYSDSFGGTLNPRMGLILSPTLRSTFKVLYGEAFRAPSAYEQYYYATSPSFRQLEPETIRTYEVAFEQYVGLRDRVNISVYRYDVDDLITQQADGAGDLYFANLSRVKANGVEMEIERRYEAGSLVRFSYALQKTSNPDTRAELTSSPRHLAKANVALPVFNWGSLGAEAQYQGSVGTLSGAREGAFTIANVSFMSAMMPGGLQASVSILNLFDARYAYPGAEDHLQDAIEQDGRTFRLTFSRRF